MTNDKIASQIGLVAALPLLLAALSGAALAADLPDFLANRQSYQSGENACKGSLDESEGSLLEMTVGGIFGYEFGCIFVGFTKVPGAEGDTPQFLATAICGDDSGVSRPDAFWLFGESNGSVSVTSQNDYVQSFNSENSDPAQSGIVQSTFMPCGG